MGYIWLFKLYYAQGHPVYVLVALSSVPAGPVSHLPAPCRSLVSHRAIKIAWLDRLKQLSPTSSVFVSAVVSACNCPCDRFNFVFLSD